MNMTNGQMLPRAVSFGELWGQVDCYILDDGRRVIAQRGILRSLRNTEKTRGNETGNLGQFLARLPKHFEDLTRGNEIVFVVPQSQGGVVRAIGRPPEFFVGILRAYAEGFAASELHKSQEPMARRAIALLSLLAEKGIEALIDEACGVARPAESAQLAAIQERYDAQFAAMKEHVEARLIAQREELATMLEHMAGALRGQGGSLQRATAPARRRRVPQEHRRPSPILTEESPHFVRVLDKLCHEQFGGNTKKMAAALGIKQSAVSQYRSGEIKDPRTQTVQKVAGFLGATIGAVLGTEESSLLDGYSPEKMREPVDQERCARALAIVRDERFGGNARKLADALDRSEAQISRLLSGRAQVSRQIETATAGLLGVTVSELRGEGSVDPLRPSAVFVRMARAALGWTQSELAERAGLTSRVDIVHLEKGRTHARSGPVREGLARAFGVEVGEISAVVEGKAPVNALVERILSTTAGQRGGAATG